MLPKIAANITYMEQIVIATGRFQTVHLGTVAYLSAAKKLAESDRCRFVVLTGPNDAELPIHGRKDHDSIILRRPLLFRERQVLLSVILGIVPEAILVQDSSPHHGPEGLTRWVERFFDPVVMHFGRQFDIGEKSSSTQVKLAVVIKASDVKTYIEGKDREHYTSYLLRKYPWLRVVDLATSIGLDEQAPVLGASEIPRNKVSRARFLPPVMIAAEAMIDDGMLLMDEKSIWILTSIYRRFGNQCMPTIEVMSYLKNLMA